MLCEDDGCCPDFGAAAMACLFDPVCAGSLVATEAMAIDVANQTDLEHCGRRGRGHPSPEFVRHVRCVNSERMAAEEFEVTSSESPGESLPRLDRGVEF